MAEERHNKIIKLPPENFSIKALYDMFLDFLQEGDDGWELIRNKPWPYGAVLKVPNWKDGEYGYACMMFGQIKSTGKTHSYSVNTSSSYGSWIVKPSTLRKYVARQTMNLATEKDFRFTKNHIQAKIVKEKKETETKRYNFKYGEGVLVTDVLKGSTSTTVSLKDNPLTGTIYQGTYITIGENEYVITKNTAAYTSTYQEEKKDENGDIVYDADGKPVLETKSGYAIDIDFYPELEGDVPTETPVAFPSKEKETITVVSTPRQNDDTSYWIAEAEQFYTNADVIWFNMIKQYESDFDWNELMENTRKNPSAQRMGWKKTGATTPTWETEPPLYPGEGCPVIASSPTEFSSKGWEDSTQTSTDSSDSDEEIFNVPEYVYVYMSKTKHNANLAVNYKEWWDMAQIGFFEPFASDYEYQFPAMVISSNIGARPHNQLVSYGGGDPTPYDYMLFDYTQGNRSLGHSMIGHSATWWNGSQNFIDNHGCSQTQAMLPNGRWESFFNYGIRSDYYYNKTFGKYAHNFKVPERVESKYFITNTMTKNEEEIYNVIPYGYNIDSDTLDSETLDAEIARQNKQEYSLMPFYLGTNKNENDRNMICVVPSLYAVSRPVTRYGLYKNPTDETDLYLIMPNCWEGRPWHYQHDADYLFTGKNKTDEEHQEEYDKYRDLGQNTNTAMHIGKNTSFSKIKEYIAQTKETD